MAYSYEDEQDELRYERRRQKRQEMRRRKQQQLLIRRITIIGIPLLIVCIVILKIAFGSEGKARKETEPEVTSNRPERVISINGAQESVSIDETVSDDTQKKDFAVYTAKETDHTVSFSDEVVSTHGIMIDMESNEILAERDAFSRMSPASMTKILTVLVAAEHIENLDDSFTITREISDFSYMHDCSNVGFSDGETVKIKDLFYGTILPSGADAAVGLATYVAGSQEAFVEMMNQKLTELGLSETAHFTNCVGIYDDNHYCTTYDMAMIMEAAMHNELCREVMSAHTYTTTPTTQHPEGIQISNWFLRRIEDKESGYTVQCAKTGYVVQSGSCAASFGTDETGKEYLCVTANSTSSWRCIYDHVAIYEQFVSQGGEAKTEESNEEG